MLQPADPSHSLVIGAAAYLAYSWGSRAFMAASHRRGMRLWHRGQFEEAIAQFEKSYHHFSRNSWIDRFRSITMLTPAVMSYREMALINIAACYVQLGEIETAKKRYQLALDEFPKSDLARRGLQELESGTRSDSDPEKKASV